MHGSEAHGCPAPSSPAPSSAAQATAMAVGGLSWLAGADAAGLAAAERAECLRGLERAESALVAARSNVLGAFTAQADFEADGHGSPRTWLKWQCRVTGQAAAAAAGWARRLREHPRVARALAGGSLSASWARQLCDWSDALPGPARPGADQIMVAAAAGGAGLDDIAGLAERIRAATARPDRDPGDGFDDRRVWLRATLGGAGRLAGDLTPGAAAALRAVLDSLGKKVGPEDTRTRAQRDHDALEEAMRRLIASGCLPDRAGQPVQIQLHMTLPDLFPGPTRNQPGEPAAPGRNGPGGPGGPGGAGRPGGNEPGGIPWPAAAPGDDCDAAIAPIVTGHVDHDLLDRLATRLTSPAGPGGKPAPRPGHCPCGNPGCDGTRCDGTAIRAAYLNWASARQAILAHAIALLSGPGGLASRQRTRTLPRPAATISLPLDLGAVTDTIPAHLRRAVIHRDRHCAFPGCDQPPAACHIHHLIPRSQGGPTKLTNLGLFCTFHHLIAIHRWGWHVRLNPDGTTTATSPDGTRTLHSHSPPPAAAA